MIASRAEEYPRDATALAEDVFAAARGEDSVETDAAKIWLTSALNRWTRSLPE